MKTSTSNWSLATRFLHLGLAGPGDQAGKFGHMAFEAHEMVGLMALAIVLMHWLWSIFNHANGELRHLFPWNKSGRQKIMSELVSLRHGDMPQGGKHGGIAGLIHGLGLLAVTGIAITGGLLFVFYPETGKPDFIAAAFKESHEVLAGFVWAYWIGHGGIAIFHQILGHDYLKNMFRFKSATKVEQKAKATLAQHHV